MNSHVEQSYNKLIFQCHLFVSKIKIVKGIVHSEVANNLCF